MILANLTDQNFLNLFENWSKVFQKTSDNKLLRKRSLKMEVKGPSFLNNLSYEFKIPKNLKTKADHLVAQVNSKDYLLSALEKKLDLSNSLSDLNKLAELLNKKLNLLGKELKVEIDQELKLPIFKIIDVETREVIRQIPLEEILKLIKYFKKILSSDKFLLESLAENLKGMLLDKEV